MKKVILATLLGSLLSVNANAALKSEDNFKFVGDTEYSSFCKAVLDDNVALFKRSLKRFVGPLGASRKSVLERVLENDNVQCAGQGIVEFSEQREAKEIAEYIRRSQV